MELTLLAAIDPNSDAYKIGRVIGIVLAMAISGGICLTAGFNKGQPVVGVIGGLLACVASFFAGCLGGLPVAGLTYLVIVMVSGGGGGGTRKKKKRKKSRRDDYEDDDRPRRSSRDAHDEDDDYDDRPRRSRRDDDYDDEDDDRPRRRRYDD